MPQSLECDSSLYKIHWSHSDSVAAGQAGSSSQVLGLGAASVSKSQHTFSEHGALARKDRGECVVTLAWTAIATEMSSKGIQGDIDPGPRKATKSYLMVRRGLRSSSAACSDPTWQFLCLILMFFHLRLHWQSLIRQTQQLLESTFIVHKSCFVMLHMYLFFLLFCFDHGLEEEGRVVICLDTNLPRWALVCAQNF